jgi:hypothetical protein
MLLINKFNYDKIEQITYPSGRRKYVTPTGDSVPSVTTILSQTGDKTGLQEWRARIGDSEANRIMREAADLGTLMHTHLEKYIMNEERPGGNNPVRVTAKSMADAIIERGLVNVSEVWGIEKGLYFPELYAGTTDLVGVYNGSPAIMDFKSSRKIKKDEHVQDYFLQLAAYSLAHNEVYGTAIKSGVIFMADREANFKSWVIDGSVFKNACESWIRRVDEWYSKHTVAVD